MISKLIALFLNLLKKNNIKIGKKTCLCFPVFLEGNIIIGNESYINSYSHLRTGPISKIVLGNNCAISNNVHIRAKTHDIKNPTGKNRKIIQKDIIIGNNVWLGVNVVIREGVTIGNNVIVGANSVVTKNIPENAIVGGVPAKIIRFK